MSVTDLALAYAIYFLAVVFIVLICAVVSEWRHERNQSRRRRWDASSPIDELAHRRRAR